MIYTKLPVVLLSTIASEKNGSTNSIIATYILGHLDELQGLGIKEMAKKCNVAVSSISRFCKEIGLNDFVELKELIASLNFYFQKQSYSPLLSQRIEDYSYIINKSINMVKQSIDLHQIIKLCHDLNSFQNIAAFGLLKAESVAINLQTDLLMLGKQIYTNISYLQQIEYILNAKEEDLIIIFSYTGSYFDYPSLRALTKKLNAPKIWMISSNQDTYPSFINELITFNSPQDQASHPYQLQFIGSLITQEYARMFKR